MSELEELQYQLAAMGMVMQALVQTHPAAAAFAAELRQIAGRSQVAGSAQGAHMPDPMRTVLDHMLRVADQSA